MNSIIYNIVEIIISVEEMDSNESENELLLREKRVEGEEKGEEEELQKESEGEEVREEMQPIISKK